MNGADTQPTQQLQARQARNNCLDRQTALSYRRQQQLHDLHTADILVIFHPSYGML